MFDDLVTKDDLAFFTSGSRFSLAKVFLNEGMQDMQVTFDLLVRDLPKSRNYLVFGGLEQAARYLLNLKFSEGQLKWLKSHFNLSAREIDYFKHFRFHGDMWAMPEGSVFFQNEPIIRITAPIIEAQIIEMFLINAVYLQTVLASKLSRFANAANGKDIVLGFN
ncbi:MAG: nicotinate phosphoribosyltransferase, partial [Patescibacteria group bacterium]